MGELEYHVVYRYKRSNGTWSEWLENRTRTVRANSANTYGLLGTAKGVASRLHRLLDRYHGEGQYEVKVQSRPAPVQEDWEDVG